MGVKSVTVTTDPDTRQTVSFEIVTTGDHETVFHMDALLDSGKEVAPCKWEGGSMIFNGPNGAVQDGNNSGTSSRRAPY